MIQKSMKLTQEQQTQYTVLCEKIAFVKSAVKSVDFYNNLQPSNETVVVASPHLIVLSRLYGLGNPDYFVCGKEHPGFLKSVTKSEFGKKYDTALVDLDKEVPYQGKRVNTFAQWFRHVISQVLKDGGTLKGKFPLQFILHLQDKDYDWFQVEKIKIDHSHCFIEVTKTPKYKNTIVEYQNGEVVEIDIHEDIIPNYYSQDVFDYFATCDKKVQYNRVTFSGSRVSEKMEVLKNNIKENGKYGLVVYSNIPKLRAEKLENIKVTSGSDCYLFDTQEERDSYFNVLQNKKVIALAKNLSYNQTINVKVQSYLINPAIFQYAS